MANHVQAAESVNAMMEAMNQQKFREQDVFWLCKAFTYYDNAGSDDQTKLVQMWIEIYHGDEAGIKYDEWEHY